MTTKPETNKILNYIVGISIVLQVLILLVPGTRAILNLETLTLVAWGAVAAAIAATWAVGTSTSMWKGRPETVRPEPVKRLRW